MIRILELSSQKQIEQVMRDVLVDPYGIRIMRPKASSFLLRVDALSNITANILKQELLSLGGDAAVARDALTGRSKRTDCLLMGNSSQFDRLKEKLARQPFGLNQFARELALVLKNYQRERFLLDLGRFRLVLGRKTCIMGIVNLTPDSFSGDGLYQAQNSVLRRHIEQMARDGADIIDIGGESSRPGAKKISVKEEIARTIPLIKSVAKSVRVPISIDTYKPEVAKAALESGAVMVNDISGLRDARMAKVVARHKAGVVLMHMKGTPRTMQQYPHYVSLMAEIIDFLGLAIRRAEDAGIDRERIIVDPGIGFGKTLSHNLSLLKSLRELKVLGRPVCVGPSRKSFIGKILNLAPQERIFGTIAACVSAVQSGGAQMVRVHDVGPVRQALKVFDSIIHH